MKKQMYKFIGIGWILGIFSCLIFFQYFGEEALWSLTILCIIVLIFSVFHHINQEQKIKKPAEGKSEKTLGQRLRIWEQ